MRQLLMALGLLSLAAWSCALPPFSEPPVQPLLSEAALEDLRIQTDDLFYGIERLRSGALVAAVSRFGGKPWEVDLHMVDVNARALRRLPLPDDKECRYTGRVLPRALADGRLAYLQTCDVSLVPGRILPEETTNLMVFDPATGSAEKLVPYFLNVNPRAFDFDPAVRRGIINDGRGIQEQLSWILPDRLEPLSTRFERAGSPSWSPDGTWIAVDAAPVGRSASGVDRLALPRDIYLLDATGAIRRTLVTGALHPGRPSWSPDGRWLTVAMTIGKASGLWLVEVSTGRRRFVIAGEQIGAPLWLPDGRTWLVTDGAFADINPSKRRGLFRVMLPDLDTVIGG